MIRASFCGLAAMSLVVAAPPLEAKTPLILKPSSAWHLVYDKEACRLVRSFGTGDEAVSLTLQSYGPRSSFEMLVGGRPMERHGDRGIDVELAPSGYSYSPPAMYGPIEGGGTMWQMPATLIPPKVAKALEAADADQEDRHAAAIEAIKTVDGLTLGGSLEQPVRLETGSLATIVSPMEQCWLDLVKSWGFDPVQQRALPHPPRPEHGYQRWLDWRDFPRELLRQNVSGTVQYRVSVGADGAVSDCAIQSAYSGPAFAEVACRKLRERGRFRPARDASDTAVASFYNGSVIFLSDPRGGRPTS